MAIPENEAAPCRGTAADRAIHVGSMRMLLEAMPIPAYVCNEEGIVVAVNTRATALWGAALQVGGSDEALVPALLKAGGLTGEGQEVRDTHVAIRTASGTSQRAFACASWLGRDDAGIGLVLKSFRLAEPPDDDARDLFENGAVGLRLVAADGTILRANQTELDLLGYRREDYVGHKLREFDADVDRLARLLERVRAGESVDKYPARLIGGDGAIRHVQISSSGRFRDGEFLHSRCFTIDVSAQEQLSRTIRQRDRLSRQLLQALPMAIYTTDVQGRITFFNRAALNFSGRRPPPEQRWCVARKLYRLDGTVLPHDECPMAIAVRTRRALRGEVAIAELPDGSRRTFAAYPTPLFNDDGSLVGAVNMMVDITEQQAAAQSLQDSNARLEQRVLNRTRAAEGAFMSLHRSERDFSLLVENVVDYAIYMLDPRGVIINWNAGAERISGYWAAEVVGTNFSRFYTPEDRAGGLPDAALSAAGRKGSYSAEGWQVRKDGSRFWASVVIDPVFDHGVLVGFAKVIRDVTERMQAEAALMESEYLARGIIDTALDGFVQLDGDGRIVQWNPQAEVQFGWPRREVLGKSLCALAIAEADRARFDRDLRPSLSRPSRGTTRRIEMVDREGRRIPVELSISSLIVNESYHTNIFIHDLSERLLVDAQLHQAQKMEAVGQLTGGLAHDFNNLLQGIIGSLDLIQLRMGEGNTADVQRFISGALSSANRAAAMTHRLLAFSKRQPLDPRPVQSNPLILSMADLLQRTLGEKVTLMFELATDLSTTLCDPNQLEGAVLNLAINARDAMPQGGCLHIRSRNVEAGEIPAGQWPDERKAGEGFICIEVSDDGVGMDAQVLEHAVEPFFTTKAPGHGTGLGLSMVYGFARQSNGYCEIHSEPTRGTTVRLYLPRLAAKASERGDPDVFHAPAPTTKGELVLVVEDEEVVRHVVVEVLHQLGYKTLEAMDGESGLAAIKANDAIRLLVSDIVLPGMDGRALATAAHALRPDLRILLMTGYAADTPAPAGLAPVMGLLTKPFTVETLAGRLRKMLGETRAAGAP